MRGKGQDEEELPVTTHLDISGHQQSDPKTVMSVYVCVCTDLVVCVRGSVISGFITRMTGFEPSLEVAEGVIICQH